ncbi:MAG: glycosyltransferase [Cystobacterineae bacterium]|nr:glycosyltransferase [Cystobacterineae bacterium]
MGTSLRILHLFASPFFSGPAEFIAQLALAQRSLGHSVSVAIDRRRQRAHSEELAAARFRSLGLLDESGLELSVKPSFWGPWKDVARLHSLNVDILHCHFSHDHWVTRLARPKWGVLVRSFHAPRSLNRWTPKADAFTVATPEMLKELKLRFPGVSSILHAPIIDDAFVPALSILALRKQLGFQGNPVVGMISTFQESRRHMLGLSAFKALSAEFPQAQFVLAGDGVLENKLRLEARRLEIEESVLFLGYQTQEKFVEVLKALDEVWILGLGNDHAARAAVQARACGVRILGVAQGALSAWVDEVVEPNEESILNAHRRKGRREVVVPSKWEIAKGILELYEKARGRSAFQT